MGIFTLRAQHFLETISINRHHASEIRRFEIIILEVSAATSSKAVKIEKRVQVVFLEMSNNVVLHKLIRIKWCQQARRSSQRAHYLFTSTLRTYIFL